MLFYSYFKTLVGKEVSSSWESGLCLTPNWVYPFCRYTSTELLSLQVTVELKNDLAIQGTLHSVDQYLNIKLHNTRVVNEQKYPHMVQRLHSIIRTPVLSAAVKPVCMLQMSVRNCFIRGSVVRYVQVSQHACHNHVFRNYRSSFDLPSKSSLFLCAAATRQC